MRFSASLQEGVFLSRPNRFTAIVAVNGVATTAHVPNSGRMVELFQEGNRVLLTPAAREGRKTAYDLALVDVGHTLVSSDSRLPSALLAEAFAGGRLDRFSSYSWVRKEVPFSHSRLDLLFGNGGLCYVEAKSVTLVKDGVGLFPDAPTSRGARHLRALVQAREEGHRAAIAFVVQRDDARTLAPNDATDPRFGEALREARSAGVGVYAFGCRVSPEEIVLGEPIPVCIPELHRRGLGTP